MDGVAGVLVVLEVDGGGEEEREYFESGVHPNHACARSLLLQLIWSKLNISQPLCQVSMSQRIVLIQI